jgi:hypothetical protein
MSKKIRVIDVLPYRDSFIIFTRNGKIFEFQPSTGAHTLSANLKDTLTPAQETVTHEKDPD